MNAYALLAQLLELVTALLLAPLLTGWVNQCRAWLQNRSAPPVLQSYYTLSKLFRKDEAEAEQAAKLALQRLEQLQTALDGRDWMVADRFSVADLLLAEVLRIPTAHGLLDGLPILRAYHDRALARPAFGKALADHMAHWQAAGP